MNAIPFAQTPLLPSNLWKQVKRIGPLGAIILLHIAFFYALQSGLIKKAADAIPKEVFVSFITPEKPPEPAPPKEPPKQKPKTVPVVKKTVAPPLPVIDKPSPTAVTAPPSPPQPVAPVAVAPEPSPEPAPPATPAVPRTVSGVEYIQAPHSEYPPAARRMHEEGKVLLHVLINEKGRADQVDIQQSSGSPRLDEAGRQAVRRARFKPYTENGKAIPVFVTIPINFQLES